MKLTISKAPLRIFWAALLFCTLYSTFRYPLKMASSETSPTYSDTPTVLQAAKFAGVLILCCVSAFWAFKTRIKPIHAGFMIILLYVIGFPLVKVFLNFDLRYIEFSFWPLAALILVLSIRKVSVESLDKYLFFVLLYSLVSNAIEVALFLLFGRLPAQGYPNSIIVRFGGWLDAPNDFACLIMLLSAWAWHRYKGSKRLVVETALFVCLILTQSLTAYVFYLLIAAIVLTVTALRRIGSIITLCALAVVVAFVAVRLNMANTFDDLVTSKADSISGHMFPWEVWSGRLRDWLLFGSSSYNFYENWWASSLINYGVVWVSACALLLLALLVSVVMKYRSAVTNPAEAVFCGFLLFAVYCVVGSFNLPMLMLFPINFLFYVFCFLVLFDRIENRTTAVRTD